MRLLKLLISVLLLASFMACGSLFNNGNDGPDLSLETTQASSQKTTFNGDTLVFDPQFYRDGQPSAELPQFKSAIEDNTITINGYFLSPSGGFQPEATLKQQKNRLTVTLKRPEDPGNVNYGAVGWFYDLTLSNISDGTYTVEIIHKSDLMRGKIKEERTAFINKFTIQ